MVKEGYKETEIGVIPEDWNVKKINDIAIPKARIGWQNLRKEEYLTNGNYLLITGTDFSDGKIVLDKCYYVSKERYIQDKNIQVSNGAVLITKDGTLGKVALVDGLDKPATLNAGVFVLNNLNDNVDNRFLYQYLRTNSLLKYATETSTGGTIKHLNQNVLINFCVPYPSKEEQQKIAEALSDMDNLISSLEKLIEKKKAIKQACLQKMFPKEGESVPEMRLPGFTDAWEQRKLRGMASLITKGTTPLDKSNTGVVNFVKIESIDESSSNITITQKISLDEHNGYLRRSQLKENDILFSIAGTLGRVTSVKSSILPANTNQALAIIRLKDGCLDYVKTYLKGKAVADFVKKNPTIGAQPNLSLEQVANLEISIPSEDEQKIIGAFFQQLDNLITLHQRKLEKYKKIKEGMMQQLLTGKIRLI